MPRDRVVEAHHRRGQRVTEKHVGKGFNNQLMFAAAVARESGLGADTRSEDAIVVPDWITEKARQFLMTKGLTGPWPK